MALRIISGNNPRTPLQNFISKMSINKRSPVRNTSSASKPSVPWLEKPSVVFSEKALKHEWGAIPIIIFTAIGFTLECLAIARISMTRDDTYYTKTAACDIVETRKGYKAPIRKFLVFNQKYETPPKLIEALQGDPSGPSFDKEEEDTVAKKIIAAHAISSLGVLYLASVL